MNNVVRIGGMILLGLGVLALVLSLVSPGEAFDDLRLDTAALLLAGGLLTLGLSGLTAAVESLKALVAGEEPAVGFEESGGLAPAPSREAPAASSADGSKPRNKPHKPLERPEPDLSASAADIGKAAEDRISVVKQNSRPTIEGVAEEVSDFAAAGMVADETVSEEELYVVEERTIAGKPARILSDGTVEAETDEGWMRFENVDHLEEYMDAVRSQRG